MSIILVGYRGSGKTTIGRLLAESLGHAFLDVDARIVALAGKSIRDIFAQDGEPAFRDIETRVVLESVELHNHVIAFGGGTLGRERNRAAVQNSGHRVFYLRTDPATLLMRIALDPATGTHRPALTSLGGGIEEITQLLATREPHYRSVMHYEIDVTRISPAGAVEKMHGLLIPLSESNQNTVAKD